MDEETWQVEEIRWRKAWNRADKALSTIDTYVRCVDAFLRWCSEEGKETTALSSADLYVDHVQSSSTAHAARHAARGIKAYGKFIADDYETADPFKRLRLPAEPQVSAPHAAMATDEDLELLLGTCDTSTLIGARDYAILTMLAATGMRRGEVLSLTVDDVDLVGQTIRVRTGKTDAAKRVLFMPDDVQGALLKYKKFRDAKIDKETRRTSSPWLDNLDGALWITNTVSTPALAPNGFTQTLRKKGLAVGVDVRAHGFRRRHAGQWMADGGSETGLMSNSGWKSTAMIAHYTRDVAEANAMAEARRLAERKG